MMPICCLLGALAGAENKAHGDEASASSEPAQTLAAMEEPNSGFEAPMRYGLSGQRPMPSRKKSEGGLVSSIMTTCKEEMKRFSGSNEARKWDMLARAAAYEMIEAFGVGSTIEF